MSNHNWSFTIQFFVVFVSPAQHKLNTDNKELYGKTLLKSNESVYGYVVLLDLN